jgi:hypothetical protein
MPAARGRVDCLRVWRVFGPAAPYRRRQDKLRSLWKDKEQFLKAHAKYISVSWMRTPGRADWTCQVGFRYFGDRGYCPRVKKKQVRRLRFASPSLWRRHSCFNYFQRSKTFGSIKIVQARTRIGVSAPELQRYIPVLLSRVLISLRLQHL